MRTIKTLKTLGEGGEQEYSDENRYRRRLAKKTKRMAYLQSLLDNIEIEDEWIDVIIFTIFWGISKDPSVFLGLRR